MKKDLFFYMGCCMIVLVKGEVSINDLQYTYNVCSGYLW